MEDSVHAGVSAPRRQSSGQLSFGRQDSASATPMHDSNQAASIHHLPIDPAGRSNLPKSYLKRNLTPQNRSPAKVEICQVVEESSHHEFVGSPQLPLFKSISDKPTLDSKRQAGIVVSEFPSPGRVLRSEIRPIQRSEVDHGSDRFTVQPTLFESHPSGGDHSKSRSGKGHEPFNFNPDFDSFAKQVHIRDFTATPSPPLDGGSTLIKRLEFSNKLQRKDNVFRLTLERAEDSWHSPKFALVDHRDSQEPAGSSRGQPALRRILLPISCSGARTVELNRSGETVFTLGEGGLSAHNIFSHKLLTSNPSRRHSSSGDW